MKKIFFLSAICITLCMVVIPLSGGAAYAQEVGTAHYYNVPESEYRDNYQEWRTFLEYSMGRERCQHYQAPPAGYVMKGCELHRLEERGGEEEEEEEEAQPPKPEPSVSSYTIYFDLDKTNILNSEREKLGKVAREILKYNPSKVKIYGYAGRAGSEEHNQKLSEKRGRAVVHVLTAYGIKDVVFDQKAYGETHLAISTEDGVRMPENRRVVIKFTHE